MDTISAALIAKPFELEGREVRFLRKSIEANIENFARKLGIDQVLKLLEEIRPEARTVAVEVRKTPRGYDFELEDAA